jgi:membrane protein YdbS with pleckstrin-like domain
MVVGLFFLINYPEGWIWALSALGAVIVVAAFGILWIPPRAYRASGYRIDEKVLEVRKGIWFQVLTLLPLSRLQHVDLNRGPLERMFGLASLHLHTAGTEHSSVTIEGLTEADAVVLRDRLVEVGAGGDDAV